MKLPKSTYALLSCLLALFYACSNDDVTSNNTPALTIEFAQTIGGSKNESARSIIKTNDGGYAILGYTQSMDLDISDKSDESFDFWILKYDTQDILQWSKTYGGSLDDRGSDIIQTQDGGYAIIGSSGSSDQDVSTNYGLQDYWLVKLDASGTISWEKSLGFPGVDNGLSILQTTDGGFLLTGVLDVTASGGDGNTNRNNNSRHAGGDYWAIKLDASANLQWSQYYGGSFTDTPYSIVQSDNGFIIVGSSDSEDVDISNNKGDYDFWVVNISDTGELLWEKSFGGSQIDEARGIIASNDGNYIIVGDTRSNDQDISQNSGAADLWIIKVTPQGDMLWERTIGGSNFDVGRSISKTQDGGLLISGSSRSSDGLITENKGQNDAWVLKLNSNADITWQKTIGGSEIDFGFDAVELNDQSVIVIGESSSNNGDIIENKGFSDALIIKLKEQ